MKTFIVFLLLAAGVFAVGGFLGHTHSVMSESPITPTKSTPTPTPILNLDSMKIYNLINDYRVSQGLNKLVFDPSMCDFTKRRLTEIHTDPSHSGWYASPPSFYTGKNWVGENLAERYNTNEQVVSNWLASPEHLENIVKPVYTRTCVETDKQGFAIQEFASY